MNLKTISALLVTAAAATAVSQAAVIEYPMDLTGTQIASSSGQNALQWHGNLKPMQVAGTSGRAWRTDGYTTYAEGNTGTSVTSNKMTASVRFAIDTNVVVGADDANANNYNARFVDCIDGNQGFAFLLGRSGQYELQVYVGGKLVSIASDRHAADGKLQLWQWNELTATVDGTAVKLYLNGTLVGQATAQGTGVKVGGTLTLGRDKTNNNIFALARMGDFNGAIDHVRISDTVETPAAFTPVYADLNLPADRYEGDRQRAKYHGQPGMNWTNETHGMIYNPVDGKYHLTFQRTGSAPVMSHAHFGHIVSENLYDWSDEKPLIWPTEDYDLRGCWSGCLFTDSQINGGKPTIIYPGVGYNNDSHAAVAYADDWTMRQWKKDPRNPYFDYNNTARDTYFFRVDDDHAYFIIGDEGHMKSYKYSGGTWAANGNFYNFQDGETGFTEMPNVSKLSNGKWLMTYTPYTGNVQCLYRIGDIDSNGRFVNFSAQQLFDCFARDGFCLMSPTITKDKNGNLIAMGIVADKMPTEWNISKGYAHLYSLPRQIDVDAQGRLVQKPFEGHKAMRGTVSNVLGAQTLNGKLSLNPVRGRQAEVCATFKVGDVPFGINFLQDSRGKGGKVTYDPASRTVSLDVTGVVSGEYGMKTAGYTLPVYPAKGEEMKLHLFIDHSVCDLFINDRYATSFRVFPDDSMANDLIEIFSQGETQLVSAEAYMIHEGDCSASPIEPYVFKMPENSGRTAMVVASDASAQERAASAFYSQYADGTVIPASQASRIKAADYDAVWVHIDRSGLSKGYNGLPAEFRSLTDALKDYVAQGGHVYLSGAATQMVAAMGRTQDAYSPNEVNFNGGGNGDDEWTVNAAFAGNDHRSHRIFSNLETSDIYSHPTYGMLWGGGSPILREDHNCMWNLSSIPFITSDGNKVHKFETDCHAAMLGTWGQITDDSFAGLVEFYPIAEGAGTIIANGLAACQWQVSNGSNAYEYNLWTLTGNVLSYLAPANGQEGPDEPEIPDLPQPEDPEVPESTGKVALYIAQDDLSAYPQELAAVTMFADLFPNGTVYTPETVSSLNADDCDALWIHTDRCGIQQGWQNLPAEFRSEALVNVLKNFVANGGNLYLSKQAAQLVVAIGRTSDAPTEFASGDGGHGTDMWQTNVAANGTDHSAHAIFYNLPITTVSYGKVIDMLGNPDQGGLWREDHNCMWKLQDLGGHDNFCTRNNAKVLGTWGHNGGHVAGGLIEFMPASDAYRAIAKDKVDARKGTVIANGLAAYELAPRTGTNAAADNLRNITSNILAYLSPVEKEAEATGIEARRTQAEVTVIGREVVYTFDETAEIHVFTADGRKIACRRVTGCGSITLPAPGLYLITVSGATRHALKTTVR